VLEYDGASGAILRWYAYGLGSNDVLDQVNVGAATRATFVPDVQGSMVATLDSGSGAFTKAGYLPYGSSGSTGGTFRYTGQRIDAETGGLYYYRGRTYSPTLGRFVQVDPMGYEGGVNLYAYVFNDPLNLMDPFGTGAVDAFNNNYLSNSWEGLTRIPGGVSQFTTRFVDQPLATTMSVLNSFPAPNAIGSGVSVGAAIFGAGARVAESATARLLARVEEIHGVLDSIAQNQRTTAILRTEGGNIVAGGVRDLTPAQRASLEAGEIAARLRGAHAEVTALAHARAAGLAPEALATIRPICSACAAVIEANGGRLTSRFTATFDP
jgi:RHS repeat-associated protein